MALGSAPFESSVLAAVGRGRTHVVRRCVDIADLLATAASGQGAVALVSTCLAGLDRQAVDALEGAGVTPIGLVEHTSDPAVDALRRIGVVAITVVNVDAESLESSIAAAAARRDVEPAGEASAGDSARLIRGAGRL